MLAKLLCFIHKTGSRLWLLSTFFSYLSKVTFRSCEENLMIFCCVKLCTHLRTCGLCVQPSVPATARDTPQFSLMFFKTPHDSPSLPSRNRSTLPRVCWIDHLVDWLKKNSWDFPGSPVVGTLCFRCRRHGSWSLLGIVLHAMPCAQKRKRKNLIVYMLTFNVIKYY